MEEKINRGMYFEEFVLSVLKQMCIQEEKRLLISPQEIKQYFTDPEMVVYDADEKREILCDAIAPDGISNIAGPVFIEIKYNSGNTGFKPIMNNIGNSMSLYIIHGRVNQDKERRIENSVFVWDRNVIAGWKHKYPIDYYCFFSEELRDSPKLDFESKVAINKKLLRKEIQDHHISLALGAGASLDFGSLSWDKLIQSFYVEIQKSGKITSIKDVQKKIGGTSIIDGQFAIENLKDFMSSLYNGIYGKFTGGVYNYHNSTIMSMENFIKKMVQSRINEFNRFNIITYNYDDFLEQALQTWRIRYVSVYNENIRINSRLSVYHPHGFLPYKTPSIKYDEYRKGIVFSESEYHALYNNPYSWAMVLQEHLYRESAFLFVGCSLSDPNLRRILENTKTTGKTHFAFMLTDGLNAGDQFIVHRHFMRLGVECIWFNTPSDLQAELRSL